MQRADTKAATNRKIQTAEKASDKKRETERRIKEREREERHVSNTGGWKSRDAVASIQVLGVGLHEEFLAGTRDIYTCMFESLFSLGCA